MIERIVINLGKGSWQQGFPTVVVQLWQPNGSVPAQFSGQLPADPDLLKLYKEWQTYFLALNANLGTRQSGLCLEIEAEDITNISDNEFETLCQTLKHQFNTWLSVASFINVDRQLRTQLSRHSQIQLIVEAEDPAVRQFPWHLWHFLEDYPQAEVAIAPLEHRKIDAIARPPNPSIRVLVILGDTTGIEVARDHQLLTQISLLDAVVLKEPTRETLNQHLWDKQGWDMLFFAGHSIRSASGKGGQLQINKAENLSIEQLKHGLKTAIKHGLQLAIFNSCDGMGLSQDLADLQLPSLIVMREPVPDRVAQAFLMHFLQAFATGVPFYLAVREAREQLQSLESTFPCASWLPVICQNPTAHPLTWESLQALPPAAKTHPLFKRPRIRPEAVTRLLMTSLLVASLLIGGRSLGLLQSSELKAFDHLLQQRPRQPVDERILIVTVDQADKAYQDSHKMNRKEGWSLSDTALALLIEKLKPHSPSGIGLDIHYPFEFSPRLTNALKGYERFIGACASSGENVSPDDSQPPPGIPLEQIGFSDFPVDADNIIRRAIVVMGAEEPCTTHRAFSLQLAHAYLSQQGIGDIKTLPDGQRQLGQQILIRLTANAGSYQLPAHEASGYQILLNSRYESSPPTNAEAAFNIIPLRTILAGGRDTELPNLVNNRIILIGVDQPWQDQHTTAQSQEGGVMIHAQILSQLLDTALGEQALIWWWPQWAEALWILLWTMLGTFVGWAFRAPWVLSGTTAFGVLILYGLCLWTLFNGGWIPLIPSAIAFLLSATAILFSKSAAQRHPK